MSGINQTLFTTKEALLSNLTAINVTGANIANVNTPGYSRLRPMFESAGTTNIGSTQDQAGVRIADVQRIYNKFLEEQMVNSQSAVSDFTAQKDLLQQIEGVLNESSGNGINDALAKFWNSWSNLSADPASQIARAEVISTAQNLVSIFTQRSVDLETIQTNTDTAIAENVDTLNTYLNDMASLNNAIVKIESAGGNTSSLRDKRGDLLTKISDLIDIDYMEKRDGSLYIYLPSSGKTLIEEGNVRQLQVQRNSENNNLYDIVFQEDPTRAINGDIAGGKLAGLITVRDEVLPSYLNQLNQTATSIVNKVNQQHKLGYDQNGNPGIAFFNAISEAKYMAVSDQIIEDNTKIAASATVGADGDNATLMTAMKDDPMYSSLGVISMSDPTAYASGKINNIGQAYKDTLTGHPITFTRGATALATDWTITDNGGYSSAKVLTANDSTVTLDLNGNGTADMTFSLSGSWSSGDTMSFSLTKNDGTSTIDTYYNSFIAVMGQDVVNASNSLEANNTIATQQNQQRESLSGVSLDEEMMNLIKYQMAYNAAGRMAKTVSEIMDLLINLGQ